MELECFSNRDGSFEVGVPLTGASPVGVPENGDVHVKWFTIHGSVDANKNGTSSEVTKLCIDGVKNISVASLIRNNNDGNYL